MAHCIIWDTVSQETVPSAVMLDKNDFAVDTSNERFSEELRSVFNDISDCFPVLSDDTLDLVPSAELNGYLNNDPFWTMLQPINLSEPVSNHPTQSSTGSVDLSSSLLIHDNLPISRAETASRKRKKSNKKEILLSDSVAVGLPVRPVLKIEIVYPLEKNYRPRYKSDYFAQNGLKRKPRYVADRNNNHYITLKVPKNIDGLIRIDWLTVPDAEGRQYTMPYKFQPDNESMATPDCNPHFVKIAPDESGIMKLYLVLIKSKQDALRQEQPLKLFRPIYDSFNGPEKSTEEIFVTLTPKKLIEKHQLRKSVLAFTLCSFGHDGVTPIAEWQTTVMSTVLSEEKNVEEESPPSVTCPNCSQNFHVSLESIKIANNQEPTEKQQKQTVGSNERKVNSGTKKSRTVQVLAEP